MAAVVACSEKTPKPSKFTVPALKFGPYFSLTSDDWKAPELMLDQKQIAFMNWVTKASLY